MLKTFLKLVLPAVVLIALLAGRAGAGGPPLVAAATDLRDVLPRIAAAYTEETGQKVKLTFGATGNLARQIKAGAPFELLLAADDLYVRDLLQDGDAGGPSVHYATGSLALFVPHGSSVKADPDLTDLKRAVHDGRLKHLALANPDHAPYGRAARESLQGIGILPALQGRLILGESAAQAMQFGLAGGVDAALVPLSLARNAGQHGSVVSVSPSLYKPLRQQMVLVAGSGAEARRFYQYIQGERARSLLKEAGFTVPARGD